MICAQPFPPASPEGLLRSHLEAIHPGVTYGPTVFRPGADRTELAIDLLRTGSAIYPAHPLGGRELVSEREATTDRATILAWWAKWPWAQPMEVKLTGAARAAAKRNGTSDTRDVILESQRHEALRHLARRLQREGLTEEAIEAVLLDSNRKRCRPPLPDEEARGIARAASSQPAEHGARRRQGLYVEENGCILQVKKARGGEEYREELANFSARIVEQVVYDDGQEERREFHIDGKHADGAEFPRAKVPAEKFAGMAWPISMWGSSAVISAGNGANSYLRAAIQELSLGGGAVRRVYRHSGWRNLGGLWYYLHAGGAIGENGSLPGVEVSLEDRLSHLRLPDPPERRSDELQKAIGASLGLLEISQRPVVGAVVLGGVFRALLAEVAPATTAIWLEGPTGAFKSQLAALAQAHFGTEYTSDTLPANWGSTANAIERLCFVAKDAVLVVDDFAPTGSGADIAKLHAQAERLIRALGNQAGRVRMNADGTLRSTYVSRGFVISTGEDVPRGQSLKARLVIISLERGEIESAQLARFQQAARVGTFALATSAFARWLAPRIEGLRTQLRERVVVLREKASRDARMHRRTPDAIANIMAAWEVYLQFAQDDGGLSADDAQAMNARVWKALLGTMQDQSEMTSLEDPCVRFIELLRGAMNAGRCHVTDSNGKPPHNPHAWGWAASPRSTLDPGLPTTEAWLPRGHHVGFLPSDRGGMIFLLPEAAYLAAQEFAKGQGEALSVMPRTLWKRLRETGRLLMVDEKRGNRFAVRRKIEGHAYDVLVMDAHDFGGMSAKIHQAKLAGWLVEDQDDEAPAPPADPAETVLDVLDDLLRKAGKDGEAARSDVLTMAADRGVDDHQIISAALDQLVKTHQITEPRVGVYARKKVKWS